MPYANIVFIKLFLNLFDKDDRFLYQLNESQQLLYIKLLYLAGRTNNQIPKNIPYICNKINYNHDPKCFESDIERIRAVFPKFKEHNNLYSFEKFYELHNFKAGKSKGTPKVIRRNAKGRNRVRVRVRERVREESEKESESPQISDLSFSRKKLGLVDVCKNSSDIINKFSSNSGLLSYYCDMMGLRGWCEDAKICTGVLTSIVAKLSRAKGIKNIHAYTQKAIVNYLEDNAEKINKSVKKI